MMATCLHTDVAEPSGWYLCVTQFYREQPYHGLKEGGHQGPGRQPLAQQDSLLNPIFHSFHQTNEHLRDRKFEPDTGVNERELGGQRAEHGHSLQCV